MAHYVEHLTFRGRAIESGQTTTGASGIDTFGNAYTTQWATTYHWTVPPTRAGEAVVRALQVLEPLDVSAEAASQERQIVQREQEQGASGPDARIRKAIDAALHEGTPLAHTVIGTASDIDTLDLDGAQSFHTTHYRPENATLILAGSFDVATLTAEIDANGDQRTPRVPTLDVMTGKAALSLTEDVPAYERTWSALVEVPTDAGIFAATQVLGAWLDSSLPGAPQDRLVRSRDDIRRASISAYEVVPGILQVSASLVARPGADGETLDAPWAQWDALWSELLRDGLDEETTARLSARLLRNVERMRADPTGSAWDLVAWLEAGASHTDWIDHPAALATVAPGDVTILLERIAVPYRTLDVSIQPGPALTSDGRTIGAASR